MYEQNATGWAKHLDFIILDMICLEVSMVLAYVLRHGWYGPFQNISYRNLGILLLFLDFALLLFLDTLKNVLRRGIYQECVYTLRHVVVLLLTISVYLFAVQEGADYSRTTIFSMCVIYFFLSYLTRIGWKKRVRQKTENKNMR